MHVNLTRIVFLCISDLLHSMSVIGKQGDNAFSPANKLAQESSIDKNNPVYGLKRDVVRLIGNLVYKNKGNQDKVRNIIWPHFFICWITLHFGQLKGAVIGKKK